MILLPMGEGCGRLASLLASRNWMRARLQATLNLPVSPGGPLPLPQGEGKREGVQA